MKRIQDKYFYRCLEILIADMESEFIGISKNYLRILDASIKTNKMRIALLHYNYQVNRIVDEKHETEAQDVIFIWKTPRHFVPWDDYIERNPDLIIYLFDTLHLDEEEVPIIMKNGLSSSTFRMVKWIDVFDTAYYKYAKARPLKKYDARSRTEGSCLR